MFNSKPPAAKIQPNKSSRIFQSDRGIELGDGIRFNPEALPNGHVVAIGASGSGKTQTLKAIALDLHRTYPTMQIILIDFHGDQQVEGETCYPLHMASPHGVNPLIVNLDPAGGGPALQAIQVTATLKKALGVGPNQEGLLLELIKDCYLNRGVLQTDPKTWTKSPPTFADLEEAIAQRVEDGDKECRKLQLKMAATFQYGIFSRPQPVLGDKLIRVDLSKLPPALQSIAAESLANQIMNAHRLAGEISGKLPRTYLFIDEAKEMPKTGGSASDRIIADGRKYGLALVMASQSERHLSLDVIGNSSTKIVLAVDQTEVKKVATKFRFSEAKIAQLQPMEALVRMGKDGYSLAVKPYWQRVDD